MGDHPFLSVQDGGSGGQGLRKTTLKNNGTKSNVKTK